MATATQPRALELLEEGGGKIAQGVPDQRDLNKFMKLLPLSWQNRYFSRQSKFIDQSSTPAHTVIAKNWPSPTIAAIPSAFAETHPTADSDIIRTTTIAGPLVSGCGPKLEQDFPVVNPIRLTGVSTIAADGEPGLQPTRADAVTTTTIIHPEDPTSNFGTAEDGAIDPVVLGREHRISSEPNPIVASAGSDPTASASQQELEQKEPDDLPKFKFIGGRSHQLGKRTIWRKVQAFTSLSSENLYLATNLSPGAEYAKQWDEKWEPTLRAETWDLSIDQNDIFTFDLRMVGQSPDQHSMKPTILVICNESHKHTLESKLSGLVKQTVPKDVCFRVVGRRVSLASGGETVDFARPGLSVDIEKRGSYFTMMGSVAYIHEEAPMRWVTGIALSTIGGLIAVDNSLYALTTAHSLFKKPLSYSLHSHEPRMDRMFEPCGEIKQFKWSGRPMTKTGQDIQGLLGGPSTPMDWALISVLDELVIPNKFYIDKTNLPGGSVLGFMRNIELPAIEDVWICSSTGTLSGILSNTRTTVVVNNVAFRVHTVMLERCLVDGDSGSWIISQTTSKLCGYIFAKVDEMELGYMLPIEPVLDDISREMSQDTKVDVKVPDASTIFCLTELMKQKSNSEKITELLSRPLIEPTSIPVTRPNAGMPASSRSSTIANVVDWNNLSPLPPSRTPPALPTPEITSSPSHRTRPPLSPHLKSLAEQIFGDEEMQPVSSDAEAARSAIYELDAVGTAIGPSAHETPTPRSRVEMSEIRFPVQSVLFPVGSRTVNIYPNPQHPEEPVERRISESRRPTDRNQITSRRRTRSKSWTQLLPNTGLVVIVLVFLAIPAGCGYLSFWIIMRTHLSSVSKGFAVFGAVTLWLSLSASILTALLGCRKRPEH